MNTRLQRVEALLRREVADMLLRGELRDPRLRSLATISITAVRVSADLSNARVFVDVMDDQAAIDDVLRGLNRAAGAIGRHVGSKIRLKRTPTLTFVHDDQVERGAAIERTLAEIRAEQAASSSTDGPGDPDPDPESA